MKKTSIVWGTWPWGTGAAGGDRVFGNHVGVEELKPVFDEAVKNGLNLWDSAVVYGIKYKQGTLHRVKSLALSDRIPLNSANRINNFIQ